MSIQCSIIWFFTENLAHKADYERHRHVKRWTEDAKRLRAQHSNRNDTNSWLLHRSTKYSRPNSRFKTGVLNCQRAMDGVSGRYGSIGECIF